jgi:cell division protein FtsL
MIAGPLLMVWKQVYLTSASLKIDKLTDSIAVVTKEIATLRLKCEQLSSKERIEHIAQTALGLGYPSADRIVIVKVPRNAPVAESDWSNDLVAFFKKTFWGNRG